MSHPRSLVARSLVSVALALSAPTMGATGAGQDAAGALTVYSGRAEALVEPILDRFTEATGLGVDVRYGETAELAAQLLEEGDRSPADVFFAQDAGALGALADAGMLAPIAPDVLARVDPAFRDPAGAWVGVSGRARTAAHTTEDPSLALPGSIFGFTDPSWKGRLGWVPANASFQAFVTAMRVLEGEEAARSWLEGIMANDPVEYESNAAAVEGVAAGEVDVVFVNHYYLMRLLSEFGDDYPVANHFFPGGDLGSLVNVAGVGQLRTSDQPEAAASLVDFLLGAEAQTYFSESTYEYPLVDGVRADPRLPALDSLEIPAVDLGDLADLQGTVALLRDVGALE